MQLNNATTPHTFIHVTQMQRYMTRLSEYFCHHTADHVCPYALAKNTRNVR